MQIRLSTDPDDYGAYVEGDETTLPVVTLPLCDLVPFEPDDKFADPKHAAAAWRMADALMAGQTLPPVLVRVHGPGYQVLDGHHRLRAHRLAGKDRIAARIVPPGSCNV